jgi:hypothetical protein
LPDVSAPAIEAPAEVIPVVTGDLRQATEHYQRQIISACLERHQHNWASAARELGLDRANLGRMAKRLGLPERAAYCTVLFPVVALNVSAFAEGYQWTAPALAGLVLVMLGNVLVFRKPKPAQLANPVFKAKQI